ncbi:MAG TPA: chitinase [Oleiagrimonas sp.]|nr:chitinase [Oleiagrimonas sp.]
MTTTGCAHNGAPGVAPKAVDPGHDFVVSRAQFEQMFPSRNRFYTYDGLVTAIHAYPAFAHTGSHQTRAREAAAFLAQSAFETDWLKYVKQIDNGNYAKKCDRGKPYGCPAGKAAYYGRGPIMLSWNFNYKHAGDALGIDLLHHPDLVETKPAIAWKTALWYWMTQKGPGVMTAHHAMVSGAGFGQTINAMNGALECHGGKPESVRARVEAYEHMVDILDASPGGGETC